MQIYIAENRKTGNIKVGRTENLLKRRTSLRHRNYEMCQHSFDMEIKRGCHTETSTHRILKALDYLAEGREHFNCSLIQASVVLNLMTWPSMTIPMLYNNGLATTDCLLPPSASSSPYIGLKAFNIGRNTDGLVDDREIGLYPLFIGNLAIQMGYKIGNCFVLCDEIEGSKKLTLIGKDFTLDLLNPNIEQLTGFLIPDKWTTNVLSLFDIICNALRFAVNLSEEIKSTNISKIETIMGFKLNL